jgi:hypothetical protein
MRGTALLEPDGWLRPSDQDSARAVHAAIHEAGHAVAALELGIDVKEIRVGPGSGPAPDSGGCVELASGWTSSEDKLVLTMASRPAVLRWLLLAGMANRANLAAIEESFTYDEVEIDRVADAGRVSERSPLRARADEIVGRRWADVVRLARQILDSNGPLTRQALAGSGLQVNPRAAPSGVFTVTWPADIQAPGSEHQVQTALFAVAAAARVATAEHFGFDVWGVHVHAGPDSGRHGLSLHRPRGTDAEYVTVLLAGRAAAAWWLVRTGLDTTERLVLLDNVDLVIADALAAALADGANEMIGDPAGPLGPEEAGEDVADGEPRSKRDLATQLRARAARIVHQRWGRTMVLAQLICDRRGQLPVVPPAGTVEAAS